MKIGVIGAGNLGGAIGTILAARGHEVLFSFSREPEKLAELASRTRSRAGSPAEAAEFGDVILLATPWIATTQALTQAGTIRGKVIWDATNALKPDMSGLAIGTTTSAGEEVARMQPWARVVKAVPTFAEVLASGDRRIAGQRNAVYVCGDDPAARQLVAGLVEEIDAQAIDAGPLALARYTEPAGMLLAQLAYARGMGARIGTHFLRGTEPE